MSERRPTRILGLSTVVPPCRGRQDELSAFMARVLKETAPPEARDRSLSLLDRIYAKSGIEARHSVIGDYRMDDPKGFTFFPPNWRLDPFPTTAERMRLYAPACVDLAEAASRGAMREAGAAPGDITHVVVSTCTGFFAPGPDILLSQRLGLRPSVKRSLLGFMGCYAGFNALRTADEIVRGDGAAVVLALSVELCSLHFQKKPDPDFLVANSLFADGCAAAVLGSGNGNGRGLAEICLTGSHIHDGSLDQMAWRIGDTGFEMRLSPRVPDSLESAVRSFVGELLRSAGWRRPEIRGWALHPGGRKIVEGLRDALDLSEEEAAASFEVLRLNGNMSSATIFFVLDRVLRDPGVEGKVAALGFGPGLTLEGALLEKGTA